MTETVFITTSLNAQVGVHGEKVMLEGCLFEHLLHEHDHMSTLETPTRDQFPKERAEFLHREFNGSKNDHLSLTLENVWNWVSDASRERKVTRR